MSPVSTWIDNLLDVISCLLKSDSKDAANSLLLASGPKNPTTLAKFLLSPP